MQQWAAFKKAATAEELAEIKIEMQNLLQLPSAKTRLNQCNQTPIELSTKPTQKEICSVFGVDEHAFLAAQRRLERSEVNRGHDRRQIGTSEERQRLARFTKELGSDRIAQ